MKSAQDLQNFLKQLEPWHTEWKSTYATRYQHKIDLSFEQYALAQLINENKLLADELKTLKSELQGTNDIVHKSQKLIDSLTQVVKTLMEHRSSGNGNKASSNN